MATPYRSKRMRSASTRRSPRGVPAVSFKSMVGSCSILAMTRPGGHIDLLPFGFAQVGQLGPMALELGLPQRLEPGPQRGDDRRRATLAAGRAETLDLVGDDRPGRHRLLLAVTQRPGDRRAQGVHVEQGDRRQRPDDRIDVARHAEVDHQHGAGHPGEVGRREHVRLGGHGGEHDVGLGQFGVDALETAGPELRRRRPPRARGPRPGPGSG